MNKVVILLFLSFSTIAQEVQWASKIIGYITDIDNAKNILNHPDALKLGEENKNNAWHPNQNLENVFISVGFSNPMQVKQIIIAENCAVGNITSVKLIDTDGNKIPVFRNKTLSPHFHEPLWHLKLPEKTDYKVTGVYLEVDPTLSTRCVTEIDAIAITSIDTTITYANIKKLYNDTKVEPTQDFSLSLPINLPTNMPQRITKESLWSRKKSFGTQLAPVLSFDERLLFFTADNVPLRPFKKNASSRQDIWVSEKNKKGNWLMASKLNKPINNNDNNALVGISADGKRIYLINRYLDNDEVKPGFSVSRFNGKNWDRPRNLVVDNWNKNFLVTMEYTVSANEKVIIVSYTKDSLRLFNGDKDLHVSFLKKDGSWTEPKYMGNVINSFRNESAPFIAYDSKTLYFSSNGFGGYGNNDIYMTKRLDSTWTNWSVPVNLGKGINTKKWDSYCWVPVSGEYAFTCSEVPPLSEDIFKVKLYPAIKPETVAILSGRIVDNNHKPVSVDLVMQDQNKTVFEDYLGSNDDETGDYHLIVPVGTKYTLKINKSGYQMITKEIDLSKMKSLQKIELNFILEAIK